MAKSPAKKVATKVAKKEVSKLEDIKATKVGKNLIVMIDKQKHVKANITDKELKSIQTKVLLYNKTKTETRKKDIINLMKSEDVKVKEVKETKAKGIKAAIKKEEKVVKSKTKKQVEEPKDLLSEVRTAHEKGELSDQDIRNLQDLLNKSIEDKNNKDKTTPTEEKKDDGKRSRERY